MLRASVAFHPAQAAQTAAQWGKRWREEDPSAIINLVQSLRDLLAELQCGSEEAEQDCLAFWLGWSFDQCPRAFVGVRWARAALDQLLLSADQARIPPLKWWIANFERHLHADEEFLDDLAEVLDERVGEDRVQGAEYMCEVPLGLLANAGTNKAVALRNAVVQWMGDANNPNILWEGYPMRQEAVQRMPVLAKVLYWLRLQCLDGDTMNMLAVARGRADEGAASAVKKAAIDAQMVRRAAEDLFSDKDGPEEAIRKWGQVDGEEVLLTVQELLNEKRHGLRFLCCIPAQAAMQGLLTNRDLLERLGIEYMHVQTGVF